VSELSRAAAELEAASAEEVLRWAYSRFQRVAIVASFQAESTVLIDMAAQLVERPEVITLDTGRLPQETHDQIDRELASHRVRLHVQTPDPEEVRALVAEHGANPFRRSVELRRLCCDVRKSRPLARALSGYDAWVTGLRRDQAVTRASTPVVAEDDGHGGIAKVAPLVRWSEEQVWEYIRARGLDYHPLYDQGYRSIGCAPCTRAVGEGEDPRAGRWWWEQEAVKECGLHWAPEVALQ
jgi:thioredoxin-dependent adenylylsulfate APS reductase